MPTKDNNCARYYSNHDNGQEHLALRNKVTLALPSAVVSLHSRNVQLVFVRGDLGFGKIAILQTARAAWVRDSSSWRHSLPTTSL